VVSSSQEVIEREDEGVLDVTWLIKCAIVVILAYAVVKVGLVEGDLMMGIKC